MGCKLLAYQNSGAPFRRSFIAHEWGSPNRMPTIEDGMLTESQLARVTVVLVCARNPANIGAVARGMHDFGFSSLRIVSEFLPPLEAAKSAVDASEVIAAAQAFPS